MNRQLLSAIGLGLLVGVVLLPNAPTYEANPTRDPGVFLYIGQRILTGETPYLDVWDHKPPAIHYLNALGLLIGKGSAWGVLFLEIWSLSFAVSLGFKLMKEAFGTLPSLFASVAWLMSLVLVLEGGNFTEEFAIPLQFAALYLLWRSIKHGWSAGGGFALGTTGAVAFLLKPNSIGLWLSVLVFSLSGRILARRGRSLLRELAPIFVGSIGVLAAVLAYFASRNALGELVDQVFRYNAAYSATATLGSRLGAVITGLLIMSQSGASMIALATWSVAFAYLWHHRDLGENATALVRLFVIALPVELVLISLSGRGYPHYYMAWLPCIAVSSGFFAYLLITRIAASRPALRIKERAINPAMIWLPTLLFAMSALPARELLRQAGVIGGSTATDSRNATVRYVGSHTAEDDYVLMWGAETSVNFLAHRRSPTRFVYQYPLYTRGYQRAEMIEEFLDEVMNNRPALIVDSSASNQIVPPLDATSREEWKPPSESYGLLPETDDVFEYIAANYELAAELGTQQWAIYVYAAKE